MIDSEQFKQYIQTQDFLSAYNMIKDESAEDICPLEGLTIEYHSKQKPLLFYLVKSPAKEGSYSLITTLINSGISVDVSYESMPLLLDAICVPKKNDEEDDRAYNRAIDRCFKFILDKATEVDPTTSANYTPLFMAAHCESENIVYYLCERGADPSILSDDGIDALTEVNPEINPKGEAGVRIYEFLKAYHDNGNIIPENLKRGQGVDFL